jgi:hypothetical protein
VSDVCLSESRIDAKLSAVWHKQLRLFPTRFRSTEKVKRKVIDMWVFHTCPTYVYDSFC